MSLSNAKRQQAFRERKAKEGFIPIQRYVKKEWIPTIDELIKKLDKGGD